MIDVWQRQLKLFEKNRKTVNAFVARKLTKTERCQLRERAFHLLRANDFERVVDLLLTENKFLSWTQADRVVRSVAGVHKKFCVEARSINEN